MITVCTSLGCRSTKEETRENAAYPYGLLHPKTFIRYPCSSTPVLPTPIHQSSNLLKEGNEATDNSQADHGEVGSEARSRAVVGAALATTLGTAARGVAASVSVGQAVVALAMEDTLDLATTTLLGRRELLEAVADLADVLGG